MRLCAPPTVRVRLCAPQTVRVRLCAPPTVRVRLCAPPAVRVRLCAPQTRQGKTQQPPNPSPQLPLCSQSCCYNMVKVEG